MDIPLFEAQIGSDGTGIDAIALVKTPAMEELWQAFEKQDLKFQTIDEEQRRVGGFALVPDRLVYRSDENGEYNIVFRKDTIDQVTQLFFKNNKHQSVNIGHDKTEMVDGMDIVGAFQINRERGILPPKGFDPNIQDGALYLEYMVNNDTIWFDWIKQGKLLAYSIEGLFALNRVNMQEQPKTVDKPEKVGLVKQLIALLKGEKVELIHRDGDDDRREVPTQAGDILVYTGDLTTGTAVNILEEDGTETAAPDDTYELAEGDVIVVEDGIVIEITSKELIDNDMELQKQVENLQKTVDDFLKGVNDKEVALESAKKEKAAEAKFTEMSEKIVTLTEVVTEFTKSDVTPPAQKPSQSTEKVPSWKKKLDNITR